MNENKAKWVQPLQFSNQSQSEVVELLKSKDLQIWSIHNQIEIALTELYEIKNPAQKDDIDHTKLQQFIDKKDSNYGVWIYYPWSGELVRFPEEDDYHLLRTARNRNLITEDEQMQLSKATVLVAGMSVGSNAAETMVYQGTAGNFILADMDVLEPTNLNRIRAQYSDVGTHKVDIVAKRMSELDPFINQRHLKDGLTTDLLENELDPNSIDVIIDEVDDLQIKIQLREFAREHRIPVVMATDDGEDVLIDVERYDIDDNLEILHGLIPEDVLSRIKNSKNIPRAEMGLIIGKYFVGFENVPLRMLKSLKDVGKSIPAWPQLGTAATLAGVLATYCTKQIILGEELPSGRAVIGPDQALNPSLKTDEYINQKTNYLKQ